ncbi:hypothetical protein OXIME_000632 [Oxyplasma meridianum]|uniref:Zinc ribbon domain-containing protein n=1 Tax=Oxyplasma meridianum TaxID=3073602 RepID=A0AAX4NG22_9ARCH
MNHRFVDSGIIGQNNSTDIYQIQQNITVNPGSSLEFLNTIVKFIPDYAYNYSINVEGELILINSSIVLEDPTDSEILLNIYGNSSANSTGLLMENSCLNFSGYIKGDNASLRIYNSSIKSPYKALNESFEDLKYSFSNSHIYSINSSFSGLERHNQVGEFIAGGLNMNNIPLEETGNMDPISDWVYQPDSLVNIISVSLNYQIGNTTTMSNISFMLFGEDIYNYNIPAHSSPVISVSAKFNISIKNRPEIVSVLNSSSNFSIHLQQSGEQIILRNINITLLSNDTVSLIGQNNFGIYLYNSTWLSYQDSFSLNMNPYYVYSYVPNPEKNSIFLRDHSYLYAIGTKIPSDMSGETPPVYVYNNSIAAYFSILNVTQVNQFGDPLKADNNITSTSLDPQIRNATTSWNRKIDSMLLAFPGGMHQLNGTAGSKHYALLDTLQNGTNSPEFMGDYGDNTLGFIHYFSLQPFESLDFYSSLNMTYTDPYPVLNLSAPDMVSGIENSINISIVSMQGSSNLTLIKITVSNSTANVGSWNLTPHIVKSGADFRRTINISPGINIHTGLYKVTLYAVENDPFSNKTVWKIHADKVIYSTAGISTSLEDRIDSNGSLSINAEVQGLSPYIKGIAPVVFLVKNGKRTVESKNVTECFSGSSNQSFQTVFNDTGNGTEVESLISLPFPNSGHYSSFISAFNSIPEKSSVNASTYNVAIKGIGIPDKDQWAIFNGTSRYTSENGTIFINLPNGTYFFSIQCPYGFNTTDKGLVFNVNGSMINLYVFFHVIYYHLDLVEVGLPQNTTWKVAINNSIFATSTEFLQVELRPGLYTLNFSSLRYYSPYHGSETVNISNSSTLILVRFSYTGGISGFFEQHLGYTFASSVFIVLSLLYYMDIRKRSYYPCLSCGTTWPKRKRICPGCGRKMNGRNPKTEGKNHK